MTTLTAVSLVEVVVPDLGDIKNVPVIEVFARLGERVSIDETLVVIETEKATMDVPSTAAGIIREINIKVGDKLSCGTLLVMVEPFEEEGRQPEKAAVVIPPVSAPSTLPPQVQPVPSPSPAPTPTPIPEGRLPHASPSIRRFAREFGIDLTSIAGTGPKGRIVHGDLQAFVKATIAKPASSSGSSAAFDLLPWPQIDFTKFGPTERVELSKIKKISGANLQRNAVVIPHVTNFDEADVTDLESFRAASNKDNTAKLTMLAFLIKASVVALQQHPSFNASLDGDELVLKRYFHIGFAADTPNGLVVPVIRDADTKGLRAIAAETSSLAEQARAGKLKPSDMQGGCFTVSSLGGIGGTGFTPIINAPEVAILGAARASMKPIWDGDKFQPRLVLPLSLSWDHRVIDGAAAARFLVTLTRLLADFRRVTL